MGPMSRFFLVLLIISVAAGPALAQQRTKVRLAQVSHSLSFSPVYVAADKGFFTEEGLGVGFQLVQGGAAGKASISGGSVEFCACAANDLLTMVVAGLPVLGVHGIATSMTMDITVSKKFAEARGVDKKSPLKQRIAALKGAKMGVISLGGAPDLYSRWLIGLAGLSPEKDIVNIRIGGHAERRAAFLKGQIDGFMTGPPLGLQMELEGHALVLISPREVPEFRDFIHEVVIVRKDYADGQPQMVGKAARALARANNFVQDSPEETKSILGKRFPAFDPKVLSLAVEAFKEAFGRDGRMTENMWKNAIKANLEWRGVPGPSPEEGKWWTNSFLKGVPGR